MSEFNIVKCNYSLPKPENPRGFLGATSFRTIGLGGAEKSFEIKQDGSLFLDIDQFGSQEKQNISEVIEIYNNQINEIGEFDYSIAYLLTFIKGVVSEAELISFSADDNSARKQRIKDVQKAVDADAAFVKSFYYLYFFKYWKRLVNSVRSLLSKIGKKISDVTFKF